MHALDENGKIKFSDSMKTFMPESTFWDTVVKRYHMSEENRIKILGLSVLGENFCRTEA